MSKQPTKCPQSRSAAHALDWMRCRVSGGEQIVFRGQIRIYPTILPSLLRQDISEDDRSLWFKVLRRFVCARNGLTGYAIPSPHDAVAIVQHYLLKSPVIDVTGTPEVALYFAMMNPSSADTRVVYAASVAELKEAGLQITDHAFLALPFEEGGRRHRWLRQDGFTIGVSEWTDLGKARALDFARLPRVESFTFQLLPGERSLVANLGDLETVENDPLAANVRGVFEVIAQSLGCLDAVRRMMPSSGTVDAHELLIAEIQFLMMQARELGVPNVDIMEIEKLLHHAQRRHWDTSRDCSLDVWKHKLSSASITAIG